jgi:predicted SAM-dependent methyltransferase
MTLSPKLVRNGVDWILRASPGVNHAVEQAFLNGRLARKYLYRGIDGLGGHRKLMINVGGGNYFRRHWKVLDFPSAHYDWARGAIDYPHDLTSASPFPLPDQSVAFYFCSHTLEHIPQEHVGHVLREMWRTLQPGGAARFTMPDFEIAYAALLARDEAVLCDWPGRNIEERFLDFFATHWKGKVSPEALAADVRAMSKTELAEHYTRRIPRESQREAPGHHINWWTHDKLAAMLEKVGFRSVYKSSRQGSVFSELRGHGRNTGFDSTFPDVSLFVEAVR